MSIARGKKCFFEPIYGRQKRYAPPEPDLLFMTGSINIAPLMRLRTEPSLTVGLLPSPATLHANQSGVALRLPARRGIRPAPRRAWHIGKSHCHQNSF